MDYAYKVSLHTYYVLELCLYSTHIYCVHCCVGCHSLWIGPLMFAGMRVWMDKAHSQLLGAETTLGTSAPLKASPYQHQASASPHGFSLSDFS